MTTELVPARRIEIGGAFSYGWRKLMANPAPWLLVAVVGLLTGAVLSWLSQLTSNSPGSLIFGLAEFIVSSVVGFTLLSMALDAVNGRTVRIPDYGDRLDAIVTYTVATFLYGLGVAFSLVLLIVPGIMFAVAYYYYGMIVVDTGADPITALREARALSKGHRWPMFGAGLLAMAITLLGLIAFGVGILLSIPVTSLAAAHIYQQLRGRPVVDETTGR
ncbi:MAG: hypothetical protein OEV40_02835 [Acidimicrobiia bacterium]|nr:hypothetical protein [Acidimicrobiia bacterium]